MFAMKSRYDGAKDADLDSLEARLGFILSPEYRAFLLSCKGGEPVNSDVEIPGWGVTDVQSFYGVGFDEEYDLEINYLDSRGLIPDDVLTVACDSGGNRFCIGISGERQGRVFFLDHEDELQELVELAPDFLSFFSALQPDGTFD